MNDQGKMLAMPPSFNKLAAERGWHWAYALWEPTAEEREAESAALCELGRKRAEERDAAIMEAVFCKERTA